jgi:putative ABC transport system permease protein
MPSFVLDLRFALRTLRKGWWVTLVAMVSLVVAIGGNATVFGLVNGLLFRPLPYEAPERLVVFDEVERDQQRGQGPIAVSLANLADISERSRTTTAWASARPRTVSLRGTERAEARTGTEVSTGFFDVLGVSPVRGRAFRPEEGVEGGPRVVLLDYAYWVNTMGPEVDPVGRVLTLDGEPHEVIGVLPEGFDFLFGTADFWLPLTASPQSEPRDRRDVLSLARMSPTATMEQVRAEAAVIAEQLEGEYPDPQRGWTLDVRNLRYDFPSQQSRMLFWLLQGSLMAVLLIACVNITNLLLSRGQERMREIALRTALGAGRWRIVRQLLSESLLLTVAGAAGGVGLGWYGIRILANRFAGALPGSYAPVLDGAVVGFTLVISAAGGVIFGLVPALQVFRASHFDALKEGGERGGAGRGRRRLSRALVVGEVVLSLVALGTGGMMVRSFLQLQNVESGFDQRSLLTARLVVPRTKYPEEEEALLLLDGILEETRGLPGVRAAALVNALPMGFGASTDTFRVESGLVDESETAPSALVVQASPGYRETIDLALLEGRFFTDADRLGEVPVAVVSRTLAGDRFPSGSPLGERIRIQGESREIVGVVADVRQAIFQAPGAAQPGVVYLPVAQFPQGGYFLMARVEGDPRVVADPLGTALQRLDPDLALAQLLTLDEVISQFFVAIEVFNVILTGFGVMALLLAAVGVYGVLAHSVNRRRREIGVRMAVGARGQEVVRLFAREGLVLGAVGLGIGLLSTVPVSILLRSVMQGVSTVAWSTVFLAGSVLFGVVMLASVLSASRAAAVDPVKTLKQE